MRKKKFIEMWLDQYYKFHPRLNHLVLFLISFSFIVSDWMLGPFSFTELFLGSIFIFLILFGKVRIHLPQIKWISIPLVIVLVNSMVQYFFNASFDLRISMIATIKLFFYLILITGIYNYIRNQKLEKSFLVWNNVAAMLVCLLAVYIMIAIYLEGAIPWRPLVTFTRTGGNVFIRDPLVVRAKSIFMEPAHLGYYLNTILAVNLFNIKYKVPSVFSIIIVLIICATFAYTAISIMLVMVIIFLFQKIYNKDLILHKGLVVSSLVVFSLFIFFFWESINIALIGRTQNIISGTESSGYERLVLTWQYINFDNVFNILFGNGFLHTPIIWNNFAYILSDLGLFAFLISLVFVGALLWKNYPIGIVFIFMNFAKGGYLAPAYWFLIMLVLLYFAEKKELVS